VTDQKKRRLKQVGRGFISGPLSKKGQKTRQVNKQPILMGGCGCGLGVVWGGGGGGGGFLGVVGLGEFLIGWGGGGLCFFGGGSPLTVKKGG